MDLRNVNFRFSEILELTKVPRLIYEGREGLSFSEDKAMSVEIKIIVYSSVVYTNLGWIEF